MFPHSGYIDQKAISQVDQESIEKRVNWGCLDRHPTACLFRGPNGLAWVDATHAILAAVIDCLVKPEKAPPHRERRRT